jgi:hypothetical protein
MTLTVACRNGLAVLTAAEHDHRAARESNHTSITARIKLDVQPFGDSGS